MHEHVPVLDFTRSDLLLRNTILVVVDDDYFGLFFIDVDDAVAPCHTYHDLARVDHLLDDQLDQGVHRHDVNQQLPVVPCIRPVDRVDQKIDARDLEAEGKELVVEARNSESLHVVIVAPGQVRQEAVEDIVFHDPV